MICKNVGINEENHLTFNGQDTLALAAQYGTPLYLMDEDRIRENCRVYKTAFEKYFNGNGKPLYASKANSFKRIYEIMAEEDFGIDVVSSGEIYTALKAGYDLQNAYFHSNNKTDWDIEYAMKNNIGYFVVDNIEEMNAIDAEAAKQGIVQKVLLRLTPGIDTHTYAAVQTGQVDSKFGSAIETGQAEEITLLTLSKENVDLVGFHCHLGSQIFEEDVFERGAQIMLEFIAAMKEKHGYVTQQLDLGGGYGVRYTEKDPVLDIDKKISEVAARIQEICQKYNITMPEIHMEPGRSIVGDAGMTLYTAGTVKRIPGYKNYVSIDGGMTDNPRFALYGSAYTCYAAGRMAEDCDMKASIVGRCCESGDIIQENVMVPSGVCRGDIIAVLTTGAYNYSMASNYNRVGRPAMVMVKNDGTSYLAVRRESLEDIARNDV